MEPLDELLKNPLVELLNILLNALPIALLNALLNALLIDLLIKLLNKERVSICSAYRFWCGSVACAERVGASASSRVIA